MAALSTVSSWSRWSSALKLAMVCCIVDNNIENCAAMTEAVAVAKDWNIEAGTMVTDVAGLVVIGDEDTTLVGAFETADKVIVAKYVDEVIDILIHSKKSSRLRTTVA